MSNDAFYYCEVQDSKVPAETLEAAESAFDFCSRHYGGSYKVGLRWLKKGGSAYHAKVLSFKDQDSGGKVFGRVEYGGKPDELWGFTWLHLGEKEKSVSIFLAAETPPGKIAKVIGNQFFHALISKRTVEPRKLEADEKAAERFGERILEEMAAEAAEPARDRLRKVYWNQYR